MSDPGFPMIYLAAKIQRHGWIHWYRSAGGRPGKGGPLPSLPVPACAAPQAYRLAEGRWRWRGCQLHVRHDDRYDARHVVICRPRPAGLIRLPGGAGRRSGQDRSQFESHPDRACARSRADMNPDSRGPPSRAVAAGHIDADDNQKGPATIEAFQRGNAGARNARARFRCSGFSSSPHVEVTVVRNVSAESLLRMTLKIVKGSYSHTRINRYSYDTLTFCGYRHLRLRIMANDSVGLRGWQSAASTASQRFWSYAKGKLQKHQCVSPSKFPSISRSMKCSFDVRIDSTTFLIS